MGNFLLNINQTTGVNDYVLVVVTPKFADKYLKRRGAFMERRARDRELYEAIYLVAGDWEQGFITHLRNCDLGDIEGIDGRPLDDVGVAEISDEVREALRELVARSEIKTRVLSYLAASINEDGVSWTFPESYSGDDDDDDSDSECATERLFWVWFENALDE